MLVTANVMAGVCRGQKFNQVNALSNEIGLVVYSLPQIPAKKVNNKLMNGGCNNVSVQPLMLC